jgi:hypothetical protein
MKVQRAAPAVAANPSGPVSEGGPAAAGALAPTTPMGWVPKGAAEPAHVEPVATGPTPTEARNRATAEQFFEAFGRRDFATLEGLYRPDASFKDDMFTLSKGGSIMTMWKGAPPFKVFLAEVGEAKGHQVRASWVAEYEMFGRPVRNEIDSTLTFDAAGRVQSQVETWNRERWMSQALPFVPKWAQPLAYAVMRPLLSWRMGG